MEGGRQNAQRGMVGMEIGVRGRRDGGQMRDRRLDRLVRVLVPFVGEDLRCGGREHIRGRSYSRGGRTGWDEKVGVVRGCDEETGRRAGRSLEVCREGRGGRSPAEEGEVAAAGRFPETAYAAVPVGSCVAVAGIAGLGFERKVGGLGSG